MNRTELTSILDYYIVEKVLKPTVASFFASFFPTPLLWGFLASDIVAARWVSSTHFGIPFRLNVASFQKVRFSFQVSKFPPKNIPKNYPELEI